MISRRTTRRASASSGTTPRRASQAYGSYAATMRDPMDLVIRSFSFERQARIFNFSRRARCPDAQARTTWPASGIFGASPTGDRTCEPVSQQYILATSAR